MNLNNKHMRKRILFLIKENSSSGSSYIGSSGCKSGLLNSAVITAAALYNELGVNTKVEVCVDSNEIDKFVHRYRPDYCVLQAIWFTSEKLKELIALHPRVIFVVRIHSKTPFLAMEGVAVERIKEFNQIDHVFLSFNNEDTNKDFYDIGINTFYLPNIYEPFEVDYICFLDRFKHEHHHKHELNVGCFGAIRPLKNQLHQAICSIIFSNRNNKQLFFHINATRSEQNGEAVLKNIRALFKDSYHKLVEHEWMEREDFLNVIKKMDLGLQLSLTESFNIVTADFVYQKVPIIVSSAIDWMPSILKVDPSNTEELVTRIGRTLSRKDYVVNRARHSLHNYNENAIFEWKSFLNYNKYSDICL